MIQPIFLICTERSGSNLLRVMMGAHPNVTAVPPVHLLRDVAARTDILTGKDNNKAELENLRNGVLQGLKTFYSEDVVSAISTAIFNQELFTAKHFIRSLYSAIAEISGQNIVFIKENHLANVAPLIIDAFPNAQFVFQVRDPRDVMASAISLREKNLGNKFGSFRNGLSIWQEDQSFGLRMLGFFGSERVFFHRYEDLISAPQSALQSLCQFVGIPFNHAMLNYHEDLANQKDSERNSAVQNISKPIIVGNTNKFLTSLTEPQIVAVEACLGDFMDRFGYRRHVCMTREKSRQAISWVSEIEPSERNANDEWTPFYRLQRKPFHAKLDELSKPVFSRYHLKG